MPNANDRQVGGDHYRSSLQHWDVIAVHGIGYLEGCATKYLTRHRKKNGRQDVEKAGHYLDKLIELRRAGQYRPLGIVPSVVVEEFITANELTGPEADFTRLLLRWSDTPELVQASRLVEAVLNDQYSDGQAHPFGYNAEDDGFVTDPKDLSS